MAEKIGKKGLDANITKKNGTVFAKAPGRNSAIIDRALEIAQKSGAKRIEIDDGNERISISWETKPPAEWARWSLMQEGW